MMLVVSWLCIVLSLMVGAAYWGPMFLGTRPLLAPSALPRRNEQQQQPKSLLRKGQREPSTVSSDILDCSVLLVQPIEPDSGMFVSGAGGGGFQINIHNPREDIWVSKAIQKDGCFECDLVDIVTGALQQAAPDSFLLDIGGNIGLYSLAAANKGFDTFTFEPFRKNYRRICKSIAANDGFSKHMTLFDRALALEPMVVKFDESQLANRNFGGVAVKQQSGSHGSQEDVKTGISGVDYSLGITLDSLSSFLPKDRPVVIKVDVEGHECNALAGGLEYLNQLDIRYVAVEWSRARLVECVHREDIFALFAKNGLKPYMRIPNGWHELDPTNWSNWTRPDTATPQDGLFDMAWGKDLS